MAPVNALGADSVLDYMVKSLPTPSSDEQTPPLKNAFAALALFSHACMLAVGFRLIGLGEDHKIGKQALNIPAEPTLINLRSQFG